MIDVLYLAANRLEFTRQSFAALLDNTDWGQVRELVVCDDGSRDGTAEYLRWVLRDSPPSASHRFVQGKWGGPVAVMAHFLEQSSAAPLFAKVDNDTMLPPGWLPACLAVMEAHPEVELLGIEAMFGADPRAGIQRTYEPANHVGGIGLFRRSAFSRGELAIEEGGRRWFGFTAWQDRNKVRAGWLKPALPVFLLDRVPHPPWSRYRRKFIEAGWQREWPLYVEESDLWAWHWPRLLRALRAIATGHLTARVGERFTAPSSAVAIDLISRGLAEPAHGESMIWGTGPQRIFGMMRVKNEGRWIRESVESALALCERVLVLDDHSDDGTPEVCEALGERVTIFRSEFDGLNEARDKDFLLHEIVKAGPPDWVLCIDGDEVLEDGAAAKILDVICGARDVSLLRLRVAYLWGSPEQVRMDGVYGRFARPSLFRLRGQPLNRLTFRKTGQGGEANFHCSNFPRGLAGRTINTGIWLKHYGYMLREDRLRKYAWYTEHDGGNRAEDCYRHMVQGDLPGIPAAARLRHAGPLTLAPLAALMGAS